jgi:hypothetical protein
MINNSITVQQLEKLFNQFNDKFFGGELPDITIEVKPMRNNAGTFYYNWKIINRKRICTPEKIIISNFYNYPMHEVEETLIHEMIHYFICYKNLKDNNSHGRTFMKIAQSIHTIDSKYNITKTYEGNLKELPLTKPKKSGTYYIVTFEVNGKKYFSRVSKAYSLFIQENKNRFTRCTNCECFVSKNPELERYHQRTSRFSLEPISDLKQFTDLKRL